MRIYFLLMFLFATPAVAYAVIQCSRWHDIKEKWNKDSAEERAAAKKAKWAIFWALGMLVWFLTVPVLIVYGLTRLFIELSKSESK